MKRLLLLAIVIVCSSVFLNAENQTQLNRWLKVGPVKSFKPVFADAGNVDKKEYSEADLLKGFYIDMSQSSPKADTYIRLGREQMLWSETAIKEDSLVFSNIGENNFALLASYITVDRWMKADLKVACNAYFELYVDGKLKKSKSSKGLNENKISLKLTPGKHQLLIKVLSYSDNVKLNAVIVPGKDFEESMLAADLSPKRVLDIHDVVNGETVSSARISPSGNYVLIGYSETAGNKGKRKRYSVIYDLKNKKNLSVIRNQKLSQIKWLPRSDKLSYVLNFEKKSELYLYDIITREETAIGSGIKDFSSYTWAPAEDFIIYSEYVEAKKPGDLKRIYGADDRLPYFRGRSFLKLLDVKSGNIIPLTSGYLSTSLHDIHPSGNKILFSTSRMDYLEVPFRKQNLYEMNLNTFALDTIWKDKRYSGSAQYSPDGAKLLVQGAPECFGDIGKNVPEGMIANNYDSQLYLFDLNSKKAEALTYNFDPSVNWAYWTKNNELFISVGERDYSNLYTYSFKNKKFTKQNLGVDVLGRISYAYHKQVAVYTGTSIQSPNKLFVLDMKKGKSTELDFPNKEKFDNIKFGNTEEWNFVNKNGTTIYGRVYYPPHYDASKKYPVLVYYYGGTSPVVRNFGGRYPKNVWAANDYIVYILQPSGSTGFGQEFSGLHVNGWGRDAIDDIIDGTKKFLETHPAADAANVGCMGASYGGFTTMMLQTRTDIFKTAISHAGISDITSYWGEGYWGYTYSSGATAYSYPWNRRDIYVDNSPLYNADKFQNSILLLHGTADTNVPVGESKQFYMALKLLGKNAEMVLVDGENHWIVDFKKRMAWHYTIMSWFDKELKGQSQQWDDLYPEKNL